MRCHCTSKFLWCNFLFTMIAMTILCPRTGHARVFSFKDAPFAPYVRGSAGYSSVGGSAYESSSGTSTSFAKEVEYNFSGEAGVVIPIGDKINFRVGAEGLQSKDIKATGKDASGNALMYVDSGVTAFIPTATIEYNFISGNFAKVFFGVGAGYATVKFSNDYLLTDAGDTLYFGGVGANDYSISGAGGGIEGHAILGAEILAVDNVTIAIDAGYRMLEISKFTYTNDATVISGTSNAPVANGETVVDTTGERKSIDLSGMFIGISFRFYLPPFR